MRKYDALLRLMTKTYEITGYRLPAISYDYALLSDAMVAEEGVEVGTVDVDFAANLGEGDDALVAVVLPCLGRDSEQFPSGF